MLSPAQPDRIHVAFDDHRLVANAGLLLPVTLAQPNTQRLGSTTAEGHGGTRTPAGEGNPGSHRDPARNQQPCR